MGAYQGYIKAISRLLPSDVLIHHTVTMMTQSAWCVSFGNRVASNQNNCQHLHPSKGLIHHIMKTPF